MRVLVAGAQGQVARSLAAITDDGDWDVAAIGRPALDLTDAASIAQALDEARPAVIINAAAYTAVDKAEIEEAAAHDLNASGARLLAEHARDRRIPLIHLSTDYVFDGSAETAYREDDLAAPTSAYGRSKLAGEMAVRDAQPQSVVVRTA
jgi:dTDP-4-dehydrorhamnose reductase